MIRLILYGPFLLFLHFPWHNFPSHAMIRLMYICHTPLGTACGVVKHGDSYYDFTTFDGSNIP